MPENLTLEELLVDLEKPTPWRRRPAISVHRMISRWRDVRLFVRRYYERGRYGISQEDTWSLFHFIAGAIADGCAAIRDRGISHPTGVTPDEWDRILTEIEEGFRLAQDGVWEIDEEQQKKVDRAMKHFQKYFYALWD